MIWVKIQLVVAVEAMRTELVAERSSSTIGYGSNAALRCTLMTFLNSYKISISF